MNCGYGEKIALYFYGETDSRLKAEVEAHLGNCASCRGELAALSAVSGRLSNISAGPSSTALDSVMRAARAEVFRARRGFSFGLREAVAALSLAALMAGVFSFSGRAVPAELAWKSGLDDRLDKVEYLVYQTQAEMLSAGADWEYSYGLLEAESRQAAG